jgi:tetratricopeptide (TPR) repeat protein
LLFFLITVLSVYIGRRRKYAAVGWLWFVGTLVPVIGLVQVGSQAIADRYMYIPMVGLLIIVGWAVKDIVDKLPGLRTAAAVSAAVILSGLLILTRMQAGYWRNSLTLFERALKVTENNDLAESGYALALADEGRFSEAELHLRRAVQINTNPIFLDDRINLSFVLLQEGKSSEAIACLNEVIKDNPNSAKAYYLLAIASEREKKYDDAIKAISSTLKLDPNYPKARRIKGSLLLETGKLDEAIPYLDEVLQSDANQVETYENLGMAYNQSGKYKQAIQVWTKVTELKPNDVSVLNNLAWVLAAAEDGSAADVNKAVEYAERACKLTGYKEAALLDTLALAYAAVGRFNEAVTTAEHALNTAKSQNREILVGEIRSRIELYKAGRRYYQK